MTETFPIQKFRLGDRVKQKGLSPFIVTWVKVINDEVAYSSYTSSWYLQSNLTLYPKHPPYVPSERRVLGRAVTIARFQPELYRCETDAELAARHAVERAAYDLLDADERQICDYPTCSARGAGHPLACNCRTVTPKTAQDNP